MEHLIGLLLIPILIVSWLVAITNRESRKFRRCNAPQAEGCRPVIGHLHLFNSHQLIHKTLGSMADKYGPVFTIRLGSRTALAVNSWEVAKECYTALDKVFSTRPSITSSKLMGYNCAMFGLAPYGPYWREMRKIVKTELLTNFSNDMIKHIPIEELKRAIAEVYQTWVESGSPESGVLVDMKKWFGDVMLKIVLTMVGGRRGYSETEMQNIQRSLRSFSDLFGAFVLADAIPALGWIDLNGCKRAMKQTGKELDALLSGWLQEHKQRRLSQDKVKEQQDFMEALLKTHEGSQVSGFDEDTVTKATCLNLVTGSDNIAVTLVWTLSLLLNNRNVLNKAKSEINRHVGKDRLVEDPDDVKDLVYLQAIIKETMRLYPPNPIVGVRAAMEDCTLSAGYHIPAGTRLLVNAWKIQRDEKIWPDPHEFKPERFLTTHQNVGVRGRNYELIPFGSGRRVCPGISLTLNLVHLALARLLQSFEIATILDEAVDMTESPGMSNVKATPLPVLLKPVLDPEFYMDMPIFC